MRNMVRRLAILCVAGAALHALWERTHIPLYTGYEYLSQIPIIYYAVMGDVMYMLLAVSVVSLYRQRMDWIAAPSVRDIFWLAVLGFGIALFVEHKALAFGRWAYLDAMPILPFLNVGLSPVLQMTILLPLSVFLGAEIDKAIRRLMW